MGLLHHRSKKNKLKAFTVVEVMVSIILFSLVFAAIIRAISPSGTKGQAQLRTYSTAMTIANWYLNYYESEIDCKGKLKSIPTNHETDVTNLIKKSTNEEYGLIRNFRVFALATYPKTGKETQIQMYQIKITVRWGNTPGDGMPYSYDAFRWKTRPYR